MQRLANLVAPLRAHLELGPELVLVHLHILRRSVALLPLSPPATWRLVAWQANLPPQERNALFPGRSCFPLSPDEDEFAAPANLDQLNVIFSVIGTPSGRLSWIELPEMRDHLRGLSPVEPTALSDLLPGAPEAALDLLGLMLTFEPAR